MKQATLQYVKQLQGWQDGDIAIVRGGSQGGRPRPDCGEWFLGIWGGNMQQRGVERTSPYVNLAINLTLTRKFTNPIDRWDVSLDAEEDGISERLTTITNLLWKYQNEIRDRADKLMPVGKGDFIEAPYPVSVSDVNPVGPEWFASQPANWRQPGGRGDGNIYGMVSTINFGGWTFQHPYSTASL